MWLLLEIIVRCRCNTVRKNHCSRTTWLVNSGTESPSPNAKVEGLLARCQPLECEAARSLPAAPSSGSITPWICILPARGVCLLQVTRNTLTDVFSQFDGYSAGYKIHLEPSQTHCRILAPPSTQAVMIISLGRLISLQTSCLVVAAPLPLHARPFYGADYDTYGAWSCRKGLVSNTQSSSRTREGKRRLSSGDDC